MAQPERAQNVCAACMSRKKVCDKALPACGFCSSRRLLCRYDTAAPKSKDRRTYNPGRHFVRLRSPPPPTVPTWEKSSLDESLDQLARGLTRSDNIIDRYFLAFHRSLPIVSPDSLRQEATRYREERRPPPADFTVLLLAMLLIVFPTLDPSMLPAGASPESLYTTTKSAFSQAQASICTSLRLVQAAALIAVREYTCVRANAAYITLMSGAGMARVMGIGATSVRTTRDAQTTGDPCAGEIEKENLAWAIAMLERLILCEMDQPNLQVQVEYPSPDSLLPSDLRPTEGPDDKPGPNQVTLSNLDAADAGQFGRQAQSISLLDRLLTVTRVAGNTTETRLAELAKLDSELRPFLEMALSELEWRQTRSSVSVSLCVRLLFLLHESVLDTLRDSKGEADCEKRHMAWLGLNTACKMMLDGVRCNNGEDPAPVMPICCFYNFWAARRCMQEQNNPLMGEELSHEISSLLHAEEKYCKTWVF